MRFSRNTRKGTPFLTGGIGKPQIRRRHTGWAIAVGRKQSEKAGVPLNTLFFETKPQDPKMLMSRPLLPRPCRPSKGASIHVLSSLEKNQPAHTNQEDVLDFQYCRAEAIVYNDDI